MTSALRIPCVDGWRAGDDVVSGEEAAPRNVQTKSANENLTKFRSSQRKVDSVQTNGAEAQSIYSNHLARLVKQRASGISMVQGHVGLYPQSIHNPPNAANHSLGDSIRQFGTLRVANQPGPLIRAQSGRAMAITSEPGAGGVKLSARTGFPSTGTLTIAKSRPSSI